LLQRNDYQIPVSSNYALESIEILQLSNQLKDHKLNEIHELMKNVFSECQEFLGVDETAPKPVASPVFST